ncbi:hypothetical protein IVG45_02135 [Methylomonas sp. LL1]|uniref:hypothetical protein n=1 Tax=Methylomonas sp. LL1 TaxID=2785785 RepID=UPI0018C373E7|nr:hypothetical protein [Methylomonas sp. LL1]QPK63799.1 hypothetical protein IVG45_02135 [Methylomonas sp. LL1]
MIKEHFDLIIAAIVVLTLALYDVTLDLFLSLLHLLFEMLHFAFEWLELGIEHTVEHFFHTSRHGSQIVTFYILFLLGCGMLFWLSRCLPRFYAVLKQFVQQAWLRRKTELQMYWLSLTLPYKLRLFSTVLGVAYLATALVM